MITVMFILALVAFLLVVASTTNPPRAPLWIAVLLLAIIELLRTVPLGPLGR